jgi:hypothetical protein
MLPALILAAATTLHIVPMRPVPLARPPEQISIVRKQPVPMRPPVLLSQPARPSFSVSATNGRAGVVLSFPIGR